MASASSSSLPQVGTTSNIAENTPTSSGVTSSRSPEALGSYPPFAPPPLQFTEFNMSAPNLQLPVPQGISRDDPERPTTSASADTFQQAQTLFQDFDGTHFASSVRDGLPVARPRYPPPAMGMVYYPAPVPMNLNLPKRLSTISPQQLEARRRTQILNNPNPEARKSAVWAKDDQSVSSEPLQIQQKAQQRASHMSLAAPQLRASVFFERPGLGQDVEIKDKSATLTLDDLLDQSAIAPVGAFTGHMFDPNASRIYRREKADRRQSSMPTIDTLPEKKRRASFLGFGARSMTTDNLLDDEPRAKSRFSRSFSLGTKLEDLVSSRNPSGGLTSNAMSRSGTPMFQREKNNDTEGDGQVEDDPDFEMPSDDEGEPNGPPTTLLAELQIRKQAQKSRNRTALSAFPGGLHTTLLELDAVAQIQKNKRQNARVKLAWESGPDAEGIGKQRDDEDVPLGVLFADKERVKEQLKMQGMAEPDRPLGLIELREMEDNEPLSFRRARLRGQDPFQVMREQQDEQLVVQQEQQLQREQVEAFWDDGNAEETIAQRIARLKKEKEDAEQNKSRPVSKAFTEEMLQELGNMDKEQAPAEVEEETLGQRRARLQKEGRTSTMMSTQQLRASQIPQAMAPVGSRQPSGTQSRESMAGLLQHSEDIKAARREQVRHSTMRTPSGESGFYGMPGMDDGSQMDVNTMMLQQAQMLNLQNAQIASMMGLDFGIPMPMQMQMPGQMPGQMPLPMPMQTQMPMQSPMPQMQQQFMNPYQLGGMQIPMAHQGMMMPDFIDDSGRERIDAWRHTVQMD